MKLLLILALTFSAFAGEVAVNDEDQAQIVIPAKVVRPRKDSGPVDLALLDTLVVGYKLNSEGFTRVIKYIYKKPIADTANYKLQARIKLIVEEVGK